MKSLFTLIVVFCSLLSFSQTNILIQNVNHRAKELKHHLNSSRDSLLLSSDSTIFKVAIFNKHYETSVPIDAKSARIALNDLPEGRFVIEAVLKNKLIIMTLIRADTRTLSSYNEAMLVSTLKTDNPDSYAINELQKVNSGKSSGGVPTFADLSRLPKVPKSYWVEYVISNGNSSYKTLRFANKTLVDQMIAKNKLEVQSVKGKLNDLTIWEIYDTTRFLRFKRLNPDFAHAAESEFFNVKPYYASEDYTAGI